MQVVLFGAGASAGAGAVSPRPPPLGSQLFDVLQRLYSGWRSIPSSLASLFRGNFERGMAEVIKNHGFAVAPLMQEIAIFFSIFGVPPSGRNRYRSLLAVAKEQRVLWSTLNYECILESAAGAQGLSVGYDAEPPPRCDQQIAVWKLHGSCNFQVDGVMATRDVSFTTDVSLGIGIKVLQPEEVPVIYAGNTALYPAMALYAATKPVVMSPTSVIDAQKRWARHVSDATRILVVGVAPNLEDVHIWSPLAHAPGTLGFVGGRVEYDGWVSTQRPHLPTLYLGPTWESAEDAAADFVSRGGVELTP
jgi:hypothetical protein